jgi:UrcA family protein
MSCSFKFALIPLAAMLTAATPVMAEPSKKADALRVSYGDVDMTTAGGGATLLKRIEKAAKKVCGPTWTISPLAPHAISDCRRETVASAVRTLDLQTLTLAWSGSTPASGFASR